MDYTVKNPDGTINWAESHKNRINGSVQQTIEMPVPIKVETLDDRIKYAQSWNLAVALVAQNIKGDLVDNSELVEAMISRWQVYFHNKLINK